MSDFAFEKQCYEKEVDAEAARLVRDGDNPYEALRRAESIVRLRRKAEAMKRDRIKA